MSETDRRAPDAPLTPAEVCHKLFNALQMWATGEFTHRADVWRITRDAERAYRTLFPTEKP
jgi:hypothetical protein